MPFSMTIVCQDSLSLEGQQPACRLAGGPQSEKVFRDPVRGWGWGIPMWVGIYGVSQSEQVSSGHMRLFHAHTKLAIMALMPTLCSHIFAVIFIITVLGNVKLDLCKLIKRIIFQSCRLHWSFKF